jgi:hypothetical protein
MGAIVGSTIFPDAAAAGCEWLNGEIWCTKNCWVTDHWHDGSREWMRHACEPDRLEKLSYELAFGLFLVLGVLIAIALIAAASAGANATGTDLALPDADTAKNRELENEMQALLHKADQHIEHTLNNYRDRDPHE